MCKSTHRKNNVVIIINENLRDLTYVLTRKIKWSTIYRSTICIFTYYLLIRLYKYRKYNLNVNNINSCIDKINHSLEIHDFFITLARFPRRYRSYRVHELHPSDEQPILSTPAQVSVGVLQYQDVTTLSWYLIQQRYFLADTWRLWMRERHATTFSVVLY